MKRIIDRKIINIGGISRGVTIPSDIMKKLKLKEGDIVTIMIEGLESSA
jgi:antitoxin component of MazEF toxin-antitoxin module